VNKLWIIIALVPTLVFGWTKDGVKQGVITSGTVGTLIEDAFTTHTGTNNTQLPTYGTVTTLVEVVDSKLNTEISNRNSQNSLDNTRFNTLESDLVLLAWDDEELSMNYNFEDGYAIRLTNSSFIHSSASSNWLDVTSSGYVRTQAPCSYAVEFDAGAEYISIPPNIMLTNEANTVMAWIFINSLPVNGGGIYSEDSWGGGGQSWELAFSLQPGGTLAWSMESNGSYWNHHPTNVLSTGVWYLVGATWSNGLVQVWLNDSSLTTSNEVISLPAYETEGALGRHGFGSFRCNNNYGFLGKIDIPTIFNKVLSTSEVQAIYNSGVAIEADTGNSPYDSGLVLGYNLDEGAGTELSDFSGNSRTGTLISAAAWVSGVVVSETAPAMTLSITNYPLYGPCTVVGVEAWMEDIANVSLNTSIIYKVSTDYSSWYDVIVSKKGQRDSGQYIVAGTVTNLSGGTNLGLRIVTTENTGAKFYRLGARGRTQ